MRSCRAGAAGSPPGTRPSPRWTSCSVERRDAGRLRPGSGSAGADAWPEQASVAEPGWAFLAREGVADDPVRDARRVLDLLREVGGGHVVAHSYGANAALLAAQREPTLVTSLALLEPACFDLARGRPAVEEHIAAMTPVFAVADDPSVSPREFSRRFAAASGTRPPDLPDDVLEQRVARLRALRPPWGLDLDPSVPIPGRTLVVTGGSSALYEQTAEALVGAGARHVVLAGAGHRVQDVARATEVLREHWRG
ncbi:alpha/beta hydrolase [Isoptericola sp. NPDC019482]|uniref:alpha/beta fold hydrolase n=1 Tax=Isoptericola sp. NPDC019482 TaxID=3154688 RepID=UPI00348BFD5B